MLARFINLIVFDPRDVATLFVIAICTTLAGAWLGFWWRTRPRALADAIDVIASELAEHRRILLVDELTGLQNGRALTDVALPLAVQRSRETGKPLAVALLDFDDFALYNKRFGHADGDKLVRSGAEAMRRTLSERRCTDAVYRRYKGDEFVILLPGADEARASERLESVLHSLRQQGIRASCGAVLARPVNLGTPAELLAQADDALRRQKRRGKNGLMLVPARGAVVVANHERPIVPIGVIR